MSLSRKELETEFLKSVLHYKESMQYGRDEKNRLTRAIHGLRKFGFSYVLYNLARFKIPVLFGDTKGKLFFGKEMIFPRTDIGGHSLLMYGMIPHRCERKLTLWLIKNLKNDDVFYDVGGHLGFYTALTQSIIEAGEVHVFEANKKLCTYLHKNFSQSENVHIVCKAIASKIEEVDFYDASDTEDSSTSSRFDISGFAGTPTQVQAVTLDEYITLGNKPPAVIKFDIEGGEYDAILGAERTIQKHNPIIAMEIWGGALGLKYSSPAVQLLATYGYTAHVLSSDGSVTAVEDLFVCLSKDVEHSRDNFLFLKK